MGGTFRAPKVQQRVIPVVDTEAEAKKRAEKQKQETLERQRRGQESTIKTSLFGNFWARKKIISNAKIFWENKHGTTIGKACPPLSKGCRAKTILGAALEGML